MLEVVYRPLALAEIDRTADYSKAEWGEEQAKRYINDLRLLIARAAEFPRMGSRVFDLSEGYRKIVSGAHRAIYRCTEDTLIVVRVIHEREDPPTEIDEG